MRRLLPVLPVLPVLLLAALAGCGTPAPQEGTATSTGSAAPSSSAATPSRTSATAPSSSAATRPSAAASLTPAPEDAAGDVPRTYAEGCQVDQDSATPVECTLGDPAGSTTVALVGDSKALQWSPAVDRWARERGYRVVSHTKSACSFSAALQQADGRAYTSCREWNREVARRLQSDPPDVLVLSGLRSTALPSTSRPGGESSGATQAALVDGYLENLRPLVDAGTRVVALADTPQPGEQVPECVAAHRDDPSACDFPAAPGLGTPALQEVVDRLAGATLVDLGDELCPDGTCRVVDDGILTYRKGSHVTATWVEHVAPVLGERLDAALAPG